MAPKLVDLHLHSTRSDGVHPPAEVVRLAAEARLCAVAIADHDNIDATDEALDAGKRYGVEVIPAVELSVIWEEFSDIHLLGYAFDHHNPELAESLRSFRAFREGRSEQIVAKINEKLFKNGLRPIDFASVATKAGGTVGRPHIAMALIETGYARDNEDAFRNYLVPCNVPKRYFPIDEAIALIHRAGGVAVLAHPPFITNDRKVFLRLLDAFVSLGLDGIEAHNNASSNDDIDWYITQARRRNLIVTGGSDFHGTDPAIAIGRGKGNLRVPYACVEEIRGAVKKGKSDPTLPRRYGRRLLPGGG